MYKSPYWHTCCGILLLYRTNKKENQRDLNKKKGLLMNIDDVEMESVDGRIEGQYT